MIAKHVLRFTKLETHQQQNVIWWQQSGSRSRFDIDDAGADVNILWMAQKVLKYVKTMSQFIADVD